MDAPKCRLCQKRHYGMCAVVSGPGPVPPEVYGDGPVLPAVTPNSSKKIEATPLSDSDSCPRCGGTGSDRSDALLWRKERERRRKYMKARRAEGKEND